MRSNTSRKRSHERIELSYLALFESPSGGDGQGVVLDLSRGGALIALSAERPPVGQRTRVMIAPPNGDRVEVPAVVVRHEELAFAVRFPEDSHALTRLLDHLGPAELPFRGAGAL